MRIECVGEVFGDDAFGIDSSRNCKCISVGRTMMK